MPLHFLEELRFLKLSQPFILGVKGVGTISPFSSPYLSLILRSSSQNQEYCSIPPSSLPSILQQSHKEMPLIVFEDEHSGQMPSLFSPFRGFLLVCHISYWKIGRTKQGSSSAPTRISFVTYPYPRPISRSSGTSSKNRMIQTKPSFP